MTRPRKTPMARSARGAVKLLSAGTLMLLAASCDKPLTQVIVDNKYAPSTTNPLVVYRAYWQAVSFKNILPGTSSDPQGSVAASGNTAYVVLAPGWDPMSTTPPTTLVVMQSRRDLELHFDDTLRIPVDDATFIGNCAARSLLPQSQADFITQRVFPNEFSGLVYDAATCTATARMTDAGPDGP